ncbi:MAG: hypothetical protein QM768_20800 [Agriterribacter sp.]
MHKVMRHPERATRGLSMNTFTRVRDLPGFGTNAQLCTTAQWIFLLP